MKDKCEKCGVKYYTDFLDGPRVQYKPEDVYGKKECLLRTCPICEYSWEEPVVDNNGSL